MPLTPVDRRAQHRLRQLEDFAVARKAFQLELAEDQLIVEAHLEAAFGARADRHFDQVWRPGPENLSRQTDGLPEVVSRNAELDRDAMLRIDHGTRVSAISADAAKMGVLECRR